MDILRGINLKPFTPPRALRHPLTQTIIPYYLPSGPIKTPSEEQTIELPDGDKIVVSISRPKEWSKGDRIIVLIHGLAGSQDSPYLVRMNQKLCRKGYLCIRVNLRSCGPGKGLARKPYHSGRSEDTREILHWINRKYPASPITQVGFSLSANITLKMLGENNSDINDALDTAIAISPPLDLHLTALKMINQNFKIFNHFFLTKLKKNVAEVKKDFPELPTTLWPKKMDLIDFDNTYTAPHSGFKDAVDYYTQSSSLQFIENIKRKTMILIAQDDPVVETSGLHKVHIPSSVQVIETKYGGHVGFLEKNRFWMDELIQSWIDHID